MVCSPRPITQLKMCVLSKRPGKMKLLCDSNSGESAKLCSNCLDAVFTLFPIKTKFIVVVWLLCIILYNQYTVLQYIIIYYYIVERCCVFTVCRCLRPRTHGSSHGVPVWCTMVASAQPKPPYARVCLEHLVQQCLLWFKCSGVLVACWNTLK